MRWESQRSLVRDVMVSIHPTVLSTIATSPHPDVFGRICIHEDCSIADAARLMMRTGAWMLLAIDDDRTPVGMILREQLSRARARPEAARPAG